MQEKERKERKGRKEKRKEGKRGSKSEEILIVHHLNIAVFEYPEAMEKNLLMGPPAIDLTPVPTGSACPGGRLSAGHAGRTLLTA